MPLEERATDTATVDTFLLGFPQVEFTPKNPDGTFAAAIPMGILNSAELQKEIELLEMNDGSSGTSTTALELVGKIKPQFEIGMFSFENSIAQLIFSASETTPVVADSAAEVDLEPINLLSTNTFDSFIQLNKGNINESSVEVTCATITSEAVGTGDATTGDTSGDFSLDFKVKAITDITAAGSITVAGVEYTAVGVGTASTLLEVEVVIGESDTLSGDLQFFSAGGAVNVTGAILATYTPSFSTTAGDITNATAAPVETGRSETVASLTFVTGATDTVTRGAGDWIADGFTVGDFVVFNATANDVTVGPITVLTTTVMTFATGSGISDDGPNAGDAFGIDVGGDFVFGPTLGQIRLLHAQAGGSAFRLAAASANQPLEMTYTYVQLDSNIMQPFTQAGQTFNGKATIKHLPDVGSNFIWTIPNASVRLDDTALTFGTDDFVIGTMALLINDDGGTTRFGTLELASQTEAAG